MEGQITEQAQIVQMSVASIITIASAIVGTLCTAIGVLFYILEKKNVVIIDLTKSFVESNIGMKQALENNTKVIEKLPEQIKLQINAKK